MGILAYLLVAWGLWWLIINKLAGKRIMYKKQLKLARKQIKEKIRWNEDILPAEKVTALHELCSELERCIKEEKDIDVLKKMLTRSQKSYETYFKEENIVAANVRDFLELIFVVGGVVMGIRAMLVQPFKIPTSSMSPTFKGIHFIPEYGETDSFEGHGFIKRRLSWMTYGLNYINETAKVDGPAVTVSLREDGTRGYDVKEYNLLMGFDQRVEVPIGGENHKIKNILRTNYVQALEVYHKKDALEVNLKQGDHILKGNISDGDHVFVDRISYGFSDPKRGDVFVFITKGITKCDMQNYSHLRGCSDERSSLRGFHYIKRLVGMPGDTLKIVENHLMVKEKGESTFRKLTKDDHPAFEKIYSMKNGYTGHSAEGVFANGGEFKLEDDEYFAMGDNTDNSSDSRIWGVVPRENIIGRAIFIWWPFSNRWGRPE
ncbi:MAG: signal peptidase I [Lentisphaeria bacterium]|nr:signal peptidase I [Lentisphaeria bacterium]NQZ67052.1 signal peptidase I [Lentisphaeria bacterium]